MTPPFYVIPHAASLVYCCGSWYLTNPETGACSAIAGFDPALMTLLMTCRTPVSRPSLVESLQSRGLTRRMTLRTLRRLTSLGAVASTSNATPGTQSESLSEDERYLYLGRSVVYADYSKEGTIDADARLMNEYLQVSTPPPLWKSYPGRPTIPLAHPATEPEVSERTALGHLLFWTFGCLRVASFHDERLPALLKSTPSKGARHPFEAYLRVGSAGCLAPGLYHYHVGSHSLEVLPNTDFPDTPCLAVVLITAVFDRIQWRYRHSWAYKDLFYELGHVVGTLTAVARELRLRIDRAAMKGGADLDQSLEEECLAAFSLHAR